MLLITGASGAYGYFFIYDKDDSEDLEIEKGQNQENNNTVEEEPEPEEPDDPPAEDNDDFFRGVKDECLDHGGM